MTLISRFHLEDRVDEPIDLPGVSGTTPSATTSPAGMGGSTKGVWETSAEKREANLRERKAQMILAARK
jgi:coupling of ubiquitin conjugation to ER degradation protein 1